ncbi:LysR family transcriptional regulator [Dysosmobacter sp.]|uniref:LysR family transcriptional regulator n=1 Tax=Dysosmobacter sp. TaxID=2591382 RepID=UPI002A8A0DEE|nr:LysR family transcriptional regulator [Dysosmobacter sp.]MDY3280763.1 LysR family transcriptional regulator [Dysosmobacter sp.]
MQVNKNPEYFLTVARERSISKAAEKLYVSQPYLSQHIIRLEESFHTRFFNRETTPLTLTPAGEIYARYLESSRQLYQKLLQDFDAVGAARTQTLRIGFSSWRASTLLPEVLPAFSDRYPDVRLEFFEMPTSEMYRLLADDKVDLIIMNTTLDVPGYVTIETILYERILLVGNRRSPAALELLRLREAGKPLDLRLLEEERMILLRPELTLARRVDNYLDKQGVVLKNCVYTTSAATALNLVARNYGFCFLNETGVRCAPNAGELLFFDMDTDDMVHPLCVGYKKNSYLLPIARAFIDMTIRVYKGKGPEQDAPEG